MDAIPSEARRLAALLKRALLAWLLLAALAAWTSPSAAADGKPRFALVIGNADYRNAPLENPLNDARDMAEELQRAGFSVTRLENASQRQMGEAIRVFGDRIQGGGVGLFYFAGHGVQVDGSNFLLPVDQQIEREDEVPYRAIDVGQVLAKMQSAKNGTNILILDACRNNPFPRSGRSVAGGLAHMNPPVGTLIAFATSPGAMAIDGVRGRNGVYTQHLLTQMRQPGVKIEDVFKRVRSAVRQQTSGDQIPWENTSFEGDFFFIPPAPGSAAVASVDPKAIEMEFWNAVLSRGSQADYRAYLERYPAGEFAELARQRAMEPSQPAATSATKTFDSNAKGPHNPPFSLSRAEQEAAQGRRSGGEAVARLADLPCPPERKRAPIRIEVSEQVNRELADRVGRAVGSGPLAIAARLKGAGLRIADGGATPYTLRGTISSQAGRNRLMRLDEIVITAALDLVGRNGERIANALVREETYTGSDMVSAYHELVNRQADEVAVRIHQAYCAG